MIPIHFGPTELIIIFVVILLIFGVGKLPSVAADLGKGLRALRNHATDELGEED